MKPRFSLSKLVIVFGAVALLSACGASKVVSTEDNSADYKTARSLPPLKKPTPGVATQSTSIAVAEPRQLEISQSEVPEADSVYLDDLAQTEAATQQVGPLVSAPVDAKPALETLETPNTLSAKLSANVIEDQSGQARLKVDAGFDQAWIYLSENLKNSDLTVFSRNRAAGRFSIGCANIAAAPTVTKKGRWSFFNRDRQQRLDYCALQVIGKRGTTSVSVLNRSGQEVTAEYSRDVFKRLLSE